MNIKRLLLNASSILAIAGIGLYLFILNQSPKAHYPWQGFYYQSIGEYANAFGLPEEKIDTKTFTLLSDGLAHDKSNIYFGNTILPYQSPTEITDKKIQLLNDYQNYVCQDVSPIWDINTLEVLDIFGSVARDKDHAYFQCQKIDAPKEQIQVLAQYLYTNGQTIFNNNEKSIISLDGFSNLGNRFVKDKKHVYEQKFGVTYEIIEGADPNLFVVINDNFSRDQNHFYYQKIKLSNIDYPTFKPFIRHAVDKNRAYYFMNPGQISLTYSVDYNSYEEINDGYAKDKNHLYYKDLRIPNIEPKKVQLNTFGVIHDDQHAIIDGKIIINSDPQTLQQLELPDFSKDKNRVYFKGVRLVDADVQTFEVIKTRVFGLNYAKDKKGCFKGNQRSQCPSEEEMNNEW